MNNRKLVSGKDSLLAIDFSDVEKEQELWLEYREKKGKVYQDLSEYIDFLETVLVNETDSYKKYVIEKEIKKLNRQLKRYEVPSVLGITRYTSFVFQGESEEKNRKSSFSLVKRMVTRNKNG